MGIFTNYLKSWTNWCKFNVSLVATGGAETA